MTLTGSLRILRDRKYQSNITGYKKTIIKTIIMEYLKEFMKFNNQVKSRSWQNGSY